MLTTSKSKTGHFDPNSAERLNKSGVLQANISSRLSSIVLTENLTKQEGMFFFNNRRVRAQGCDTVWSKVGQVQQKSTTVTRVTFYNLTFLQEQSMRQCGYVTMNNIFVDMVRFPVKSELTIHGRSLQCHSSVSFTPI